MDLGGYIRGDLRGEKTEGEGRGKKMERERKAIRENEQVSRKELGRIGTRDRGTGGRRKKAQE